MVWFSKLQTEIALSTTAAEYVALSQSMREVIPMVNFLKEIKARGVIDPETVPTIHCTAFEDNEGAI